MDVFYSWPPVTRTLVAATLATSVLVHTGFVPAYPVVFIGRLIFRLPPKIPEIWRLVTPFLITGPKFGMLMDTYFLYTYCSGLETGSPRFSEPGSFAVYLAFVMSVIVATCGFYLGGVFFLQPLILAFAYTFSQDNPNTNVSVYIITFQAKYLAFALLAITFIMDGPQGALNQATGIVAAHLYDFLTRIWPTFGGGRNYIQTPEFVKKLFLKDAREAQSRAYGTAYSGSAMGNASAPSASASGAWTGQRGPGRRLGD